MQMQNLKDRVAFGGKITEREREELSKWMGNSSDVQEKAVELFSDQMTCFLFEALIRPADNALVIHLKHLAPSLRNPKFFDFAAMFIRDRVGKFATLNSSFIGELDSVNKLNSLDFMFTDYYPAKRGDMEFIKKHTAKIGHELDALLVRELGDLALRSNKC